MLRNAGQDRRLDSRSHSRGGRVPFARGGYGLRSGLACYVALLENKRNRIHVQVSPADDSTADIISKEAPHFEYSLSHTLLFACANWLIMLLPNSMVIMGTHGRTGLSRLLLGSVCEQVLRQTTTPLCLINMLVKLRSD